MLEEQRVIYVWPDDTWTDSVDLEVWKSDDVHTLYLPASTSDEEVEELILTL